jgi:hypothetical protein
MVDRRLAVHRLSKVGFCGSIRSGTLLRRLGLNPPRIHEGNVHAYCRQWLILKGDLGVRI